MRRCVSIGMVIISLALAGCYTHGRAASTATGALTGAALGAGTGAIIGGRHAGDGALIGGAIGALTGGLIGHGMDEVARERVERQSPQTVQRIDQGQPLGVADIKMLSKGGERRGHHQPDSQFADRFTACPRRRSSISRMRVSASG